MQNKSIEYLADLLLVFISLIWGSTFIVIKGTLEKVDPVAFLSLRFLLASFIMLPIVYYRRRFLNSKSVLAGLVLGFGMSFIFMFQTVGLKYVSASMTGFLTGLYIIFVPILSLVFLKKKPYTASIFGVMLGAVGLYVISANSKVSFGKGELFVIINALGIAGHIILTDYYSRKYDNFILTGVQIIFTGAVCTVYTFLNGGFLGLNVDNNLVFSVVLTGVFATVVAFFIQTTFQKYTTPTKAAVIFTFEPVSGAVFGYLIGGEILGLKQYVGAMIIIAGILVSEIGTVFRKKIQGKR